MKKRQMIISKEELAPLIEAEVTLFFDKEISRKAAFTDRSWIQREDMIAIDKLSKEIKTIDLLTESQRAAASIAKIYQGFLEEEGKDESSPFRQWLGEYLLIAPTKEGFPLALPKEFMKVIDEHLQAELVDRHLCNLPMLLPFFEWSHSELLGSYSLEIIMKTHEKESVECHRFRAFSLEKDTVEAFQGKLEFYNEEQKLHFENALLLYVIYCGHWKLGLPNFSYKLKSGKAVLSSDVAFVGFYQQLRQDSMPDKSLDWQTTEAGESLRQRAQKMACAIDCQFLQNPLLNEYRNQYYLAAALTKLQNKIDPVKVFPTAKGVDERASFRPTTVQMLFADRGLPWPEAFSLSHLLNGKSPQIETLKRELELLPLSATAGKLLDLSKILRHIQAEISEVSIS